MMLTISSVEELESQLGNEFIILFGSAVSGVSLPKVPMVDGVHKALLQAAAHVLQEGPAISQRLLSGYAVAFVEGEYQNVLKSTKFETFLLKLTRVVGKPRVDDLLARLYSCVGDQYGPNHAAIAHLLKERICLAALTTNFDNALELSYPGLQSLGYEATRTIIPSKQEPPWLLKLHGDAVAHTCIATSLELTQAKLRNRYEYLRQLLSGRNILVVGYGGTGDVDIAPQLWGLDARLFWCNHKILDEDRRYADRLWVKCHLDKPLSNTEEPNLLLQLAYRSGWDGEWIGEAHPWRASLEDWIRKLSVDELSEFIWSLHSWTTNWPSVHVSYVRWLENKTPITESQLTSSEIEISAYNSAERGLRRLLTDQSISSYLYRRMHQQLGFVLWRKGKYEAALRTFIPAIGDEVSGKPAESASITEVSQEAARQYLETIDEMMSYRTSIEDRRRISTEHPVSEIARYLRKVDKLLIEDEYLARIALMRIDYWIGSTVEIDAIQELIDEAMAMEEWESAALSVQLLLLRTGATDVATLSIVNNKLIGRGDGKLPRKNNAYLKFAKSNCRWPIILKLLNGRLIMPYGIPYREFEYYRTKKRWKRDFERRLREL